jgi:hypothetical protein
MGSKDPDIIASEAALRRAARRTLRIGLETGTPVCALIEGEIVDLTERYRRKRKREGVCKARPSNFLWRPFAGHQLGGPEYSAVAAFRYCRTFSIIRSTSNTLSTFGTLCGYPLPRSFWSTSAILR